MKLQEDYVIRTSTLVSAFKKVLGFQTMTIEEVIGKYLELKKQEYSCIYKQKLYLQKLTDIVVEDSENYSLKKYFKANNHECQGKVLSRP